MLVAAAMLAWPLAVTVPLMTLVLVPWALGGFAQHDDEGEEDDPAIFLQYRNGFDLKFNFPLKEPGHEEELEEFALLPDVHEGEKTTPKQLPQDLAQKRKKRKQLAKLE